MTTSIIITICSLLLLAYLFDISASKTKIPSVISLLILGWAAKQLSALLNISIPDLTPILPILGTVGLVLIVLEGSLELELNRSKLPLVAKSSIVALVPMLVLSFSLAFAFQYFGNSNFKIGLANAIPFAIISSAIAIPSAKNLIATHKEFVTYESSLSDIFGVILFNFITLNDAITVAIAGHFVLDLLLTLIITFVATILLAYLLSKIQQPVKFVPIILMIVLIYAVSKMYHLPALIFILLFGLFMGNLDELKHIAFIQKLQPNILNKEVHRFKDLTTEIVFLVRALFFLLFGFLIETSELLNSSTIIWAVSITGSIFLLRWVCLKLFKLPVKPLLFIAPRGLITILLFLSIPISQSNSIANKSLIIQVIILSALVMMFGLIASKASVKQSELSASE
jgi:potassium/hydrogen antiporter